MTTVSAPFFSPNAGAALPQEDIHSGRPAGPPTAANEMAAGMRVVAVDGPAGRLEGIRAERGALPKYLLVRRRRLLGLTSSTRLVPAALVAAVARGQLFVAATRAEIDRYPEPRPDRDIAAEVGQALWRAIASRAGRLAVRFSVANGVVGLYGHVPAQRTAQRIEELVRTVPGVLAVHAQLDDDESLTYRVARTLADDPLTRRAGLQVSSRFGHVHLSGQARSFAAAERAVELASSLPGVAGTSSAIRAEPASRASSLSGLMQT
jgi:osmotically-inducible protein OsmY